ncbi:MAG: EAL domain-containing protein [Rhodospirillales bacterium]|nr:EAL domain-containing protein [Rhodospirillales bacterium]
MSVAADPVRNSASLKAERDRFVAFAFAAADLLLEVDDTGVIRFTTGASQSLTNQAPDDLVGRQFLDLLSPLDRPLVKVLLGSLARGGRISPIAVRLAADSAGAVVLGGCRLPDEQRFYHLSLSVPMPGLPVADRPGTRDEQTGLFAKDEFARLATKRIQAGIDPAPTLTLFRLDGLDAMRARVDDELSAGFLAAVGRHLRAHSAGGDAAGQIDDGRYGVLHNDRLDPDILARQISDLAAGIDPGGEGVGVSALTVDVARGSLGEVDVGRALVYSLNKFAANKDGAFAIASLADGLKGVLGETVERVAELRSTIGAGRFSLVFQPIVALATHDIHHYEALSRFPDNASPAEVVAFAEQVGVVAEFDLAVCARVIHLIEERGVAASPPIAVNISGRSFESAAFIAELEALLAAHPGVAGRLMFELTESAAVVHVETTRKILKSLRKRGFKVCLDDFGAGAASFHYLHAFAVDFVKIDGKYVKDAIAKSRDKALLRSIAALCREIGVHTIAEMVETDAQAAEIKSLGVHFGQGYLFGRPAAMPKPAKAASAVAPPRLILKSGGVIERLG